MNSAIWQLPSWCHNLIKVIFGYTLVQRTDDETGEVLDYYWVTEYP